MVFGIFLNVHLIYTVTLCFLKLSCSLFDYFLFYYEVIICLHCNSAAAYTDYLLKGIAYIIPFESFRLIPRSHQADARMVPSLRTGPIPSHMFSPFYDGLGLT